MIYTVWLGVNRGQKRCVCKKPLIDEGVENMVNDKNYCLSCAALFGLYPKPDPQPSQLKLF